MAYPSLTTCVTAFAPTVSVTELPGFAQVDQSFEVASAVGWSEVDANGIANGVPLGQSGPFEVLIGAEKVLCASAAGGLFTVYNDEGVNGRGYGSTSVVIHRPGTAVSLLSTSVQSVATGGGGGGAGNVIVRKFPFAYNTPNILTGAALYTPTVGDVLLDFWVEIDTAWNGTTPLCDVGMFVAPQTHQGFLAFSGIGAIDLTQVDDDSGIGVPSMIAQGNAHGPSSDAYRQLTVPAVTRVLPAKFTGATPVKVVVSQDGTNTGASPASTQGAAVLYLVTATPV